MSIIVACAIIHRDGYQCVYCSKTLLIKTDDVFVRAEVDHILPRSQGGLAVPSNLVTSCMDCIMARRWGKLPIRKVFDAITVAWTRALDTNIGRQLAMMHYPSRVRPLKRDVEVMA